MRCRLILSVAVLLVTALLSPSLCLANRTWHDIHGGDLRGTFKGLEEQKAVIQTSTRLVRIPFWNLTTEDQKFIARRMRDWRQNDKVPTIAANPRDWLIDGRTVAGQLLRVEGQELWIVIDGRKRQFSLDQLSDADAEHARSWTQPIIQKTSVDRWDPFVATETQPAAKEVSPEAEVAAVESAAPNATAASSTWLTHRSFRLGITALVCLTAFAWRILRRVLRSGPKLDF
jgi:hypothetical protein